MLLRIRRRLSRWSAKLRRKRVRRGQIEPLFASVPRDATILEIGGGYNPRYVKSTHPNTYHLDHHSADELRLKWATEPTLTHLLDRIQPVDFVYAGAPIETLVPPELRFDVIYGSHVLEHQVDLIGHLQSLEKLLAPGGRVIEFIPDLRCCFDALRFPSVTSDALLAHLGGAPHHRGKQVFDAMACEIDKNHGTRMAELDFEGVAFRRPIGEAWQAMRAADAPGQPYADMHAWTFTPESFRLLMVELRLLGLTGLEAVLVTPNFEGQFAAVLQRTRTDLAATPEPVLQALRRERLALARQLRLR